MKKFNIIGLLLAVVGVLSMTSCQHEYADYTPGPQDDNLGVYFKSVANFQVTAETTSVDVVVLRSNTAEAAQVSVRSQEVVAEGAEQSGLFTIPSSVSFAAGAEEATLTIAFNGELELGKKYSINIQLDPSQASQYAISENVFTIVIPEPWVEWGQGIYVDDFFRVIMAAAGNSIDAGYMAPVAFQKHETDANRIRVVNPAGPTVFGNMWGGVPGFLVYPNENDAYMEFDITDPSNVKLASNPTYLNVSANFGADGVLPLVLYVIEDEEGNYAAPIVYEGGKIIFPKDNVVMGYIYEGELSGWLANSAGMLMYAVPGTVLADYSMLAEYTGMTVAPDHKTTSANLDFYYAGDVDTFKFTVLEGNVTDVTDAVAAIVAGSEDIVIYEGTTEADMATFSVPLANTGMYTVVAVPYNAAGEAQADSVYVYSFYFPGLGSSEIPEVEIQIAVDSVVGITGNPAYEANYPSASSMCIYMAADGTQLKSIVGYVGQGVPADVANEEVLANGEDFTSFIPDMVQYGYALAVYTGLTEGATYDVVLGFETIYGEFKTYRTTYTPKAAASEEEPANPEASRFQFRTFAFGK